MTERQRPLTPPAKKHRYLRQATSQQAGSPWMTLPHSQGRRCSSHIAKRILHLRNSQHCGGIEQLVTLTTPRSTVRRPNSTNLQGLVSPLIGAPAGSYRIPPLRVAKSSLPIKIKTPCELRVQILMMYVSKGFNPEGSMVETTLQAISLMVSMTAFAWRSTVR